jgi:hypothetical protein
MGTRKVADMSIVPVEQLKPEVLAITAEASKIVVASQEQLSLADVFLKGIKAMRAKVKQLCDPVVTAAHLAHKAACDLRSSLDDPLKDAEHSVKVKTGAYLTALETARRAEEQKRMDAALAEAKRKQEQDALLFDAIGDEDAAAEVMTAPVIAKPIEAVAEIQKPKGISMVSIWKARVLDIDKVPREFLVVDQRKLDDLAKAMKDGFKVDGCEAYEDKSVRVSS